MVTSMKPELNPSLARLFSQAREPLDDGPFMANLVGKIERARRARLRRQILAIAAIGVIASLNMRLVLEMTAAAVRFVGDFSPAYTELLITPWGWAVSMLVGIWVVLRTRPSRR
jgi:hypothetical protein